jgi:sugar O-acyltransferase (sialic acid O-acetyltransferase NeuD family)
MNKAIYILGVGRNTEVYIDLVEACGYNLAGLYHYNDDRTGENVHGVPILDSSTNLFKKPSLAGMQFAISVGDNKIRSELANTLRNKGGFFPTLIHPSSVVSKFATLGQGVAVNSCSVVQAGVSIDVDTVISSNVTLGHTCRIGKACYLALGAVVGAYVTVEDKVLIGLNSVIISSKADYIGENAIVGAGTVVTKKVDANTIVAGNPARIIKKL